MLIAPAVGGAFKILTIMAIFEFMSSESSYPHNIAPDPSKTQNTFQPENGKHEQGKPEFLWKLLIAAGVILMSVLSVVIVLKIAE